MSEKYKVRNPEGIYFVTTTIVNWIDLLTRPVYKHILVDTFKYSQKHKHLVIHGYVIMSNHCHLILRAEQENLSDVIRGLK